MTDKVNQDHHAIRVKTGYRIQFNSTLGPYKGGTRFHPSVNMSELKMSAMEATFKNALTGCKYGFLQEQAAFKEKDRIYADKVIV